MADRGAMLSTSSIMVNVMANVEGLALTSPTVVVCINTFEMTPLQHILDRHAPFS